MTSVSTDRRDGVNSNKAIKVPCLAATTGQTTLNGEQTIDDVVLISGDRVLVPHQDDPVENGIYVVDVGDWVRALDFDSGSDMTMGTMIRATGGSAGVGFWLLTTADEIIVGETGLDFTLISTSIGSISSFIEALLALTNAAAFRAAIGAAASGGNTDITSLNGPALGAASATTPAPGDNDTSVATTAFVTAALVVLNNALLAVIDGYLLKSGGTMTGNLKTKTLTETLTTGNSSTGYAVDLSAANVFEITMTGNCTFTFTNPPASGTVQSFTLKLIQDATGSRTATWPASVKWPGAIAPALTTTAARADFITFVTTDGGTKYDGFVCGQNFA